MQTSADWRPATSGNDEIGLPLPRQEQDTAGALRLDVLRPDPSTTVIKVSGEVDLVSAPRLSEFLQCRLRGALDVLVLDLSSVSFLCTAGLEILMRTWMQAQQNGIELRVVPGQSRAVRRALRVDNLDATLPIRGEASALFD